MLKCIINDYIGGIIERKKIKDMFLGKLKQQIPREVAR